MPKCRSKNAAVAASIATIVAAAAAVIGFSESGDFSIGSNDAQTHSFESGSYSDDSFLTHDGPAVVTEGLQPSEYQYDGLDNLGRTLGARAVITAQDRELAKADAHPQFSDNKKEDPSGWSHNEIVEVTLPSGKGYRGYFWNRSHLIADSLGGKTRIDNWVTGTRMQNVGANDGNGGMAYTETKARDFLDDPSNVDCPVYYSAQPVYNADELVPRSVIVDIKTCDSEIDERVTVQNVMPGYEISYADGSFRKAN